MHVLLMATAFVFVQESTSATTAAARPATSHQIVDVRVQVIGLKQGFEIPEQLSNPAEFLADAKTKEQILWTTDFRGSTLAGRELLLTTGENLPIITGVSRTVTGTLPQVTFQQAGTTVRLTPKVEADERILLKLYVSSSRLHRAAPDVPLEAAIFQHSTSQLLLETDMLLQSGRTTSMSNSATNTDPKHPAEQALVLITAKLVAE